MSAPLTINQSWCNILPPNENLKLKSAFIYHIQGFHGIRSENPVKHLNEFLVFCDDTRTNVEDEEVLRLKVFLFILSDQAKHWHELTTKIYLYLGTATTKILGQVLRRYKDLAVENGIGRTVARSWRVDL